MEFVERALVVGHVRIQLPRLRDHHHHRMRQGAAGKSEKLEAIVEHRGIRAVAVDDRQDFFDVIAEDLAGEAGLAGTHPIHISAQRVDLAVVCDEAVGVRAVPAREGVRREARMDEADRGLEILGFEVEKIAVHLLGHEHALVDHGAAGKAGNIPDRIHAGAADRVVRALADDEKLPLEIEHIGAAGFALEEHLAHPGLACEGGGAQHRVIHGHFAPAEDRETLLGGDFFKSLLRGLGLGFLGRGENHTRAVFSKLGKRDALLGTGAAEEFVGHLCEDAGSVAGVVLGTNRAAVVEIQQNGQRVADDRVRFSAMDINDEANAAGVMLKCRIVEALLGWRAGEACFFLFHGFLNLIPCPLRRRACPTGLRSKRGKIPIPGKIAQLFFAIFWGRKNRRAQP